MIAGIKYRAKQMQTRAGFAFRGGVNYARLITRNGNGRPNIAVVCVGRNDDYMSDFRERLIATIDWNIRYLANEVIFVEWNPPADRKLLAHELTKRFDCLSTYVVPATTHERICENQNIKLLEYHAKNVGIRRAQADWILSTNADAAVGLDSVNTLLNQQLDGNVLWTAERWDIPWREDQQRQIGFWGSLRYRRPIPYERLGTGEFCLASRELWHRARGFDEGMVRHRIGCDVRGTAQMIALGGTVRKVGTVLHLTHPTSCTENIQPHHGELATPAGVPYQNEDHWGLGDAREVQLAERIWRLDSD
ncbi:MAG TPA: hypothetical protein VLB68_09355 [Pyrinomonadaceae bacterium]|nr:hypothetical protein [Pyrinomonadaceae bacterium]